MRVSDARRIGGGRRPWRWAVMALLLLTASCRGTAVPLQSADGGAALRLVGVTAGETRPAAVLLHGCAGVTDHIRDWADRLVASGQVVAIVDSLEPRGLKSLCTASPETVGAYDALRVGDAYAALARLRAEGGVDGDRVAVIGWSHGGLIALRALAAQGSAARRGRAQAGGAFAAGIAFYPPCDGFERHHAATDGHRMAAPLLILSGEADDWTPAVACRDLIRRATEGGSGAPVEAVFFPDAHHAFDVPGVSTLYLSGARNPNSDTGLGATVGYSPRATAGAEQAVAAFLARRLASPAPGPISQ